MFRLFMYIRFNFVLMYHVARKRISGSPITGNFNVILQADLTE